MPHDRKKMKSCSSKADLLIHSTLCCVCEVDPRKGVRGHLINTVPVLAQQLQLWLHLHAWPNWHLCQLLWHQSLRHFSIEELTHLFQGIEKDISGEFALAG